MHSYTNVAMLNIGNVGPFLVMVGSSNLLVYCVADPADRGAPLKLSKPGVITTLRRFFGILCAIGMFRQLLARTLSFAPQGSFPN